MGNIIDTVYSFSVPTIDLADHNGYFHVGPTTGGVRFEKLYRKDQAPRMVVSYDALVECERVKVGGIYSMEITHQPDHLGNSKVERVLNAELVEITTVHARNEVKRSSYAFEFAAQNLYEIGKEAHVSHAGMLLGNTLELTTGELLGAEDEIDRHVQANGPEEDR